LHDNLWGIYVTGNNETYIGLYKMSTIFVRFSPILEVLIFKFDGYCTRGRRNDTCERTDGHTDMGTNGYD